MAVLSCKHFNGYKPCGKHRLCDANCPSKSITTSNLLVIHLGAIGAVVRATSLLAAIKRKYPGSRVTWVTDTPSDQLLRNHPLIDRVFTSNFEDVLSLRALEFDVAFVIDKSLKAAGILASTTVDQVFGFTADAKTGAIVPATSAANYLWNLGLDNDAKFFKNQKPETQLMVEALELGPFLRDEYNVPLTAAELEQTALRRKQWLSYNRDASSVHDAAPNGGNERSRKILLGLNTGCSSVIPYKKLTVEFHRRLIEEVHRAFPAVTVVLVGGPEDQERNEAIGRGLSVVQSSCQRGLRDGLVSIAAVDVVLTGDSLGMHLAISQKKTVVAWFGPTCAAEIDLYDRGEKIFSSAPCSPCWKRHCDQPVMCYDQVSMSQVMEALKRSFVQCERTFLSRLPFSETSSLASPSSGG